MEAIRRAGFRYIAAGNPIPQARQVQRFLDKGFLIGLLRQLEIDCVLDVGANRGQYAQSLRSIGYRGEIHSFEPIPGDFAKLKDAASGDPAWHVHNYALGRAAGTSALNLVDAGGENTVFSSFLSPAHDMIPDNVTRIDVQIRTLDEMVEEIPALRDAGRNLFLKLDTQGFDMEVCEGSKAIMPRIRGLQSEISVVQIYDNQPDYIEALQYYRGLGFSLMDLAVVNRTANNEVLEYDCIMARFA
jgi:FkbM family methyltransferase